LKLSIIKDLKINYAYCSLRFAPIFFSKQKKKQKKRKPTLWGRGFAVKVFGKNTTRGGSAKWAVAVCSFFLLGEVLKNYGARVEIFFKTGGLTLTVLWRLV